MNWIPTFIFLIVFMLFVIGIFPIRPVSIASGSMEPSIMTGDMVIISSLENDEIKVGDVVEYKRDNYSVIHRVIEIVPEQGYNYYKTQGDNNNTPDRDLVPHEAIVGKVKMRIPYLGWITLWMNSASVEDTAQNEVDIETGGTYD